METGALWDGLISLKILKFGPSNLSKLLQLIANHIALSQKQERQRNFCQPASPHLFKDR